MNKFKNRVYNYKKNYNKFINKKKLKNKFNTILQKKISKPIIKTNKQKKFEKKRLKNKFQKIINKNNILLNEIKEKETNLINLLNDIKKKINKELTFDEYFKIIREISNNTYNMQFRIIIEKIMKNLFLIENIYKNEKPMEKYFFLKNVKREAYSIMNTIREDDDNFQKSLHDVYIGLYETQNFIEKLSIFEFSKNLINYTNKTNKLFLELIEKKELKNKFEKIIYKNNIILNEIRKKETNLINLFDNIKKTNEKLTFNEYDNTMFKINNIIHNMCYYSFTSEIIGNIFPSKNIYENEKSITKILKNVGDEADLIMDNVTKYCDEFNEFGKLHSKVHMGFYCIQNIIENSLNFKISKISIDYTNKMNDLFLKLIKKKKLNL